MKEVEAAPFDDGTVEFFRAGDTLAPTLSEPVAIEVPIDEPHRPAADPERRRRLGRMVSAVVAFAAVLCVAALLRSRPHHASAAAATPLPAAHPLVATAPPVGPPPAEPVAEPRVVEPRVAEPPVSASAVREEARTLLEKREVAAAVSTGRRAVELDPEDATAWLVLGAAELESHHGAAAALAFRSCARVAKRGPVHECRAFLR